MKVTKNKNRNENKPFAPNDYINTKNCVNIFVSFNHKKYYSWAHETKKKFLKTQNSNTFFVFYFLDSITSKRSVNYWSKIIFFFKFLWCNKFYFFSALLACWEQIQMFPALKKFLYFFALFFHFFVKIRLICIFKLVVFQIFFVKLGQCLDTDILGTLILMMVSYI